MARLVHREPRALSDALLELYSPGPNIGLAADVSAILRRSLSFDRLACHEIIAKAGNSSTTEESKNTGAPEDLSANSQRLGC